MAFKKTEKRDPYSVITDSIIAMIEQGKTDGKKLWDNAAGVASFRPTNAVTNKPYNGINRLTLALTSTLMSYEENLWVTYNQAKAAGWQVRKGEKSTTLCYFDTYKDEDEDEDKARFFLKTFNVFNVIQLDGYSPSLADAITAPVMTTAENCAMVECILRKTDVKFMPELGNKAYYNATLDLIQMPPKECFTSNNAYYSVMLHELTHSTLHASRLGRGKAYEIYKNSKEKYAREELVAELGAAFLGSEIGCLQETLEFHANYIESWLKVLKSDKKAIFRAASDAQKAADFIMTNWVEI